MAEYTCHGCGERRIFGVKHVCFSRVAPPPASLGDEERAHIHTLDHPCRDTCSGWKQGYERGLSDGQPVGNHWVSRSMYEAEVEGLRTSRAELLAEREKVRKLRGTLSISRGQWIHSVNAEQCDQVLKETE